MTTVDYEEATHILSNLSNRTTFIVQSFSYVARNNFKVQMSNDSHDLNFACFFNHLHDSNHIFKTNSQNHFINHKKFNCNQRLKVSVPITVTWFGFDSDVIW